MRNARDKTTIARSVSDYIAAALHVLLTNRHAWQARKDWRLAFSEKLLNRDRRGVVRFCCREQATIALQIVLQKKCPHDDSAVTLQYFCDRYFDVGPSSTFKKLPTNMARDLSKAMCQHDSELRRLFLSPYQVKNRYQVKDLVLAIKNYLRHHRPEDEKDHAFLHKFWRRYHSRGAENFSWQQIGAQHQQRIAESLPTKYCWRFFDDLRQDLPLAQIVTQSQNILSRIPRPSYSLRIILRSLPSDSSRSRKVVLGIKDIFSQQDWQQLQSGLLLVFLENSREQLSNLIDGRQWPKQTSAGKAKLLLTSLTRLQGLKKTGAVYPNIDGRIRAAAIVAVLLSIALLMLATAAALSAVDGNISFLAVSPLLPYPQAMFEDRVAPRQFFMISVVATALLGIAGLVATYRLRQRKGRRSIMAWLLLACFCCIVLLSWQGDLGYCHAPWIFATVYGAMGLAGRRAHAHCCPDFGPFQAHLPAGAKIAIAMASLASLATLLYLLAIAAGFRSNTTAIVGR